MIAEPELILNMKKIDTLPFLDPGMKRKTMDILNPFGKRNSCVCFDIVIYSAKFSSSTPDDTLLSPSSYVRRSYCCLFPIVIARELYYYDFSNRRTHTSTKRYTHAHRWRATSVCRQYVPYKHTEPAVNAAIPCHTCTRVSAHTLRAHMAHTNTHTDNRPSLYVF